MDEKSVYLLCMNSIKNAGRKPGIFIFILVKCELPKEYVRAWTLQDHESLPESLRCFPFSKQVSIHQTKSF